MKVLLDTNFLLIPFQQHVDVFEQTEKLLVAKVKFVLLASTLQELRAMKGRERLYARAMLQFIDRQTEKFEIVNLQGKTDELISSYAEKHNGEGFYVATMDKVLRGKLKKMGVRSILVRGKGHLEVA